MAYVFVSDFKYGLDRRRPQVAGVPGTLWDAQNCFISRGGDVVRAKKFVTAHTLPAGTFGLASLKGQLFVFGSATSPVGLPVQVQYQRLQAGAANMVRVLDVKAFDGKFYVIAEYDDGGVYHFYDGARVTDWDTLSGDNSDFSAVADTLARKVNANAAIEAIAVGTKVLITAKTPGTAFTCSGAVTDNGSGSTPAATATQLVANVAAVAEVRATGTVQITAGTSSPGVNRLPSVTVDGTELLANPVNWTASNNATANALAVAINNNSAVSGYTASAFGNTVTIRAAVGTGAGPNGDVVNATPAGDVTTTDGNMAGGVTKVIAVAQVYQVEVGSGTFDAQDLWKITVNGTLYQTTGRGAGAGTSAYISKGRIFVTAGSLWRYCKLDTPTNFSTTTTPSTDAGFINMASDAEGNQRLVGAAAYQGNAAIFARDSIRIYAVFADAENISIVDTLEQTGTMAARSITPYGNLDVYYLDDTGIRSIRSRDGYDAAYVSDVGSSIDPFVQEWMGGIDEDTLSRAVAAIDPIDGRYMLAIGDRIFGLSYYPQSKITAWSYLDVGFTVQDLIRVQRRIYARSANVIYLYGGIDGTTYPDANEQEAVIVTPFLSANDPAGIKEITGFDMAGGNDWHVEALIDPNDLAAVVNLGVVNKISYGRGTQSLPGQAAMVALRMTCNAAGPASISNFALHYNKGKAS